MEPASKSFPASCFLSKVFIRHALPETCDHAIVVLFSNGFHTLVRKELVSSRAFQTVDRHLTVARSAHYLQIIAGRELVIIF
jgi:hypothetical protein